MKIKDRVELNYTGELYTTIHFGSCNSKFSRVLLKANKEITLRAEKGFTGTLLHILTHGDGKTQIGHIRSDDKKEIFVGIRGLKVVFTEKEAEAKCIKCIFHSVYTSCHRVHDNCKKLVYDDEYAFESYTKAIENCKDFEGRK